MKHVNFFQTIYSAQQKNNNSIIIVCLLTIAILFCVSANRAIKIFYIYSNYLTLNQFVTERANIIKTKKELLEQQKHINDKIAVLRNLGFMPHELIITIAKIIPSDVSLTQLVYQDKTIVLNGISYNTSSLSNFVRELTKHKNIKRADITQVVQYNNSTQISYEIIIELANKL